MNNLLVRASDELYLVAAHIVSITVDPDDVLMSHVTMLNGVTHVVPISVETLVEGLETEGVLVIE